MRLYPDNPSRRTAMMLYDLAVLVGLVLIALLAVFVHNQVNQLAVLGSGIAQVGSGLPGPIGGPVSDFGTRGVDHVHSLATRMGLLTFVIPAAIVLWQYLPGRIAQIRNLTAAARVLHGSAAPDQRRALALRAVSLPYGQLVRFTRDPFGDLAAERYDPLIAAALDDAGLSQKSSRT
jgi:hypothetical protein